MVSYITRDFPLELLVEWDAPYRYAVSSREEDVGRRWMNECRVVFEAPDDGHLYEITFDVGKTEYQEISWQEQFNEVVRLPRVKSELRTVVKEVWVRVQENDD